MTTERARIALEKRMGITPLEFLLQVLRDPKTSIVHKLDAARIAAPYMHKKMPTAIEVTSDPEETLRLVRETVGALFSSTASEKD